MAVTVTQWVAINNRNAINVEPPEKKTFIIVVVVVKPTEEKSDISITNVSNSASSIAKWKNGFVGAEKIALQAAQSQMPTTGSQHF